MEETLRSQMLTSRIYDDKIKQMFGTKVRDRSVENDIGK